MHDLLFYALSGLLVCFSAVVVLTPNLVHAAVGLVASFFMTAALYLLMGMEFVAISQVMVYIGGLVIFVIITILLTTRLGEIHLPPTLKQRLWGILVAGTLLGMLLHVTLTSLRPSLTIDRPQPVAAGSLETVGTRLLQPTSDGFLVPFELISVLLLIALIGAVVVARKDPDLQEDDQ